MRERKSGESTQSSCITSSSLVSLAAIFVSIFTQRDDTQKKRVSEYFLSTSPHIPFKYCFPFQTKVNPCMEFKEKLEPECIIIFLLFKETRCSDTLYI